MKIRNRKAIIGMACLALLGVGAGGAIAYLTDSETHSNVFTAGDVKTELEEPHWDPENADNMVPYDIVAKDPQIENSGENPEIVFMIVKVPRVNVTEVAENGTRGTKQLQEIVYMQKAGTSAGTHANAFNTTISADGTWIELTDKEVTTTTDKTYVFAYDKRLAKDEKTSTLFDQIKLKNVVENELSTAENYTIDITAYAIQADNIMRSGEALDTSDAISETDLKYIYDAYVNQADGSAAREATGGELDLAGGSASTPDPDPEPDPDPNPDPEP